MWNLSQSQHFKLHPKNYNPTGSECLISAVLQMPRNERKKEKERYALVWEQGLLWDLVCVEVVTEELQCYVTKSRNSASHHCFMEESEMPQQCGHHIRPY